MDKKTVRDINLAGKRVLVRVDFNVPIDPTTGSIKDDSRIRAAIPTIRYLLGNRCKVIVCSHLGHPKAPDPGLSLAPVAQRLSQLLDQEVKMAPDCVGQEVESLVRSMEEEQVVLLENLRFHAGEERNDPEFAQALATLADIYVNNAFAVSHRVHASIVAITSYLPSVAGFLTEKETEIMDKALNSPARPFSVIMGGTRIGDKIGMLESILDKVDSLLIAGGMGSPFLKSLKADVNSPPGEDDAGLARRLLDASADKGVHLVYPADVVIANKFSPDAKTRVVPITEVPSSWYVMDIGPRTINYFAAKLRKSRTVIWNGPVGVFEFPQFQKGTTAIAESLAHLGATTVIGGGSITEAIQQLGLAHKMTHVSNGGGASLKYLEGKPLPGIAALMDREA